MKKITIVTRQWRQKCLLVFLNASRNNLQAHESTVVALHSEVFKVSYFPQKMEVNLLSNSSKDNTGIELVEGRENSYGLESKDR